MASPEYCGLVVVGHSTFLEVLGVRKGFLFTMINNENEKGSALHVGDVLVG